MYHKMLIIARLTHDPDSRFTPSGKQVTNLRLAVDVGWGDNKKTMWVRATAWEKKAEIAAEYLEKGRQVYIEGELTPDDSGNPRVYQRNNGEWAAAYEMRIIVLQFIGSRGQRTDTPEPPF